MSAIGKLNLLRTGGEIFRQNLSWDFFPKKLFQDKASEIIYRCRRIVTDIKHPPVALRVETHRRYGSGHIVNI